MKPSKVIQRPTPRTHEGGKAQTMTPLQLLRRSVMACMLYEGTFYEDGVDIAQRISDLSAQLPSAEVSAIAIEARQKMHLRHVPLVLCVALARKGELSSDTLAGCLQRPDEVGQFLALFWANGRCPIPHKVRRGINMALRRWNEYQLAKWGRGKPITIKDAIKLCHPVPENEEERELWRKVAKDELSTPDTWEVALSSGADKKQAFERLLREKKLGALALLRNLRNMEQANVARGLIRKALSASKFEQVLPFRFLAAARAVPSLEPELDAAMLRYAPELHLKGKTILVVDVSGSMDWELSGKSDMVRMDAAAGLAILCREGCEEIDIYTFSNSLAHLAPRRGMALRDAIIQSQPHGGTYLGEALNTIRQRLPDESVRLLVITDEQVHDDVHFWGQKRYVINVAPYQHGISYRGATHIDGFSERTLDYILEVEAGD